MVNVAGTQTLPALPIMMAAPLVAEDEEFVPVRARQILGGRYFWTLLVYSALLLLVTGIIAARRHLWWDEIDVYYIAALPTVKDISRALLSGLDWQSPTYYIPLSYLVKWFGSSSLVLRSIAIVPYWLATLVVYFSVARRTTPVHGFLAMLFPTVTLAFTYSFEAKPYALVLLFTACAFLSWQLTKEAWARRFALPALGLSLAAAFAVHYNACLAALPLLAGEAIFAARRRAWDFPVLLSICSGAIPAIFLVPNILAHRNIVVVPSDATLFERLGLAYYSLFALFGVIFIGLVAGLAVWFALPRKKRYGDRYVAGSEFETAPLAVAGMFLALPIVFSVISHFTQTYYPRYVLETVIGTAIFLGLLVHGVRHAAPRLAGVLLAIFAVTAILVASKRVRNPDERAWGSFAFYSELFDRNTKAVYDSKDPLLLGQGAYLVALRYGDADLRERAFHLLGEPSVNMTPFMQTDRMSYKALETLHPSQIHVPDYNAFIREHRRFLMYDPDPWVLDRLVAEGGEVKIQATLKQRPLYAVVVKPTAAHM